MVEVPAAQPRNARVLVLVFVVALAVRAVIGVAATGRGEMEGLADRYLKDCYSLAAGYGLVQAAAGMPAQVNLIRLADSLAARHEVITPARVPPLDPARWRPSLIHPPGYAYFLLLIYRVTGKPPIPWARALQAILDAAACLLVYDVGRRLAGRTAGLVAAVGTALFLPLAYLATSRVADALLPALYVLIFWLYLRALASRRLWWFLASGVALGVTGLFRPDVLLYPVFLVPLGILVAAGHRLRVLAGGLVLVVAQFLMLLPWGIYNARVTGTFRLTSTGAGMILLESVGQFPNPYGIVFDDEFMDGLARRAGYTDRDDLGVDRYFLRRYLEIVRTDPGFIAAEIVRRSPRGVAPLYKWGYANPYYATDNFYAYLARDGLSAYQVIREHPASVLRAYWDRLLFSAVGLVLFVAGVAMLVAERRRWAVVALILAPYLYVFLSPLPMDLGGRLLVPGVFSQFIPLGYWFQRLVCRKQVDLLQA